MLYALYSYLSPKHQDVYRNIVYSEMEQAAYLARHYLEEISLGIEVSIWYKDMWGESGFSLIEGGPGSRIRPMGKVMRNLERILPGNPKEILNHTYKVSLKNTSLSNNSIIVRSYDILPNVKHNSEKLVIALWNPIEYFNGKILQSRLKKGEYFFEQWRNISSKDIVNPTVKVVIGIPRNKKIKNILRMNLLAEDILQNPDSIEFFKSGNIVVTDLINVEPVPIVLQIELS